MEILETKCPYCKSAVPADAVKCRYCGEYLVNNPNPPKPEAGYVKEAGNNRPQERPRPKNHLVGAILVTIFCCQIFGIVSIVFAAQVDSAYNRGDVDESYRLSQKAQTWFNVALITGLSVGLIYGILYYIGIASALFW